MRQFILIASLLLTSIWAGTAEASQRIIVRNNGGLPAMTGLCNLLGCDVVRTLDGVLGKLFLVTIPDTLNTNLFLFNVSLNLGVVSVELDLRISLTGPQATAPPPAWL